MKIGRIRAMKRPKREDFDTQPPYSSVGGNGLYNDQVQYTKALEKYIDHLLEEIKGYEESFKEMAITEKSTHVVAEIENGWHPVGIKLNGKDIEVWGNTENEENCFLCLIEQHWSDIAHWQIDGIASDEYGKKHLVLKREGDSIGLSSDVSGNEVALIESGFDKWLQEEAPEVYENLMHLGCEYSINDR